MKLPEHHVKYVLHGSHLLRVVCWPTSSSYKQVCDFYVAYTLHHYGAKPVVVFGDHDNSTSTKTSDHFHTTVQMLQKSEKIIAQIAWSRQISSLENGFTPCTLLDR